MRGSPQISRLPTLHQSTDGVFMYQLLRRSYSIISCWRVIAQPRGTRTPKNLITYWSIPDSILRRSHQPVDILMAFPTTFRRSELVVDVLRRSQRPVDVLRRSSMMYPSNCWGTVTTESSTCWRTCRSSATPKREASVWNYGVIHWFINALHNLLTRSFWMREYLYTMN